ncbi:MAG: PilZ domain-containing protein [Magnetococcales bacterium]|nr:PilZ domain-containing protein [Magnetococcales bacterium]
MVFKSKSSGGPRDRRTNSRVDFQQELLLKDDKGNLFRGEFGDISLRGMRFLGLELPSKGVMVHGTLNLGSISIPFKGVVIHTQPERGAAIRFQEMDVESFSHLRRLVSLNLGDSDAIDDEFLAGL